MNPAWLNSDIPGMVADLHNHARQYAVDPNSGGDRRHAMRITAIAWIDAIQQSAYHAGSAKVLMTKAVLAALQQALDGTP